MDMEQVERIAGELEDHESMAYQPRVLDEVFNDPFLYHLFMIRVYAMLIESHLISMEEHNA